MQKGCHLRKEMKTIYFSKNSGKPSRATLKVQLILAVVIVVALAGIAIPAMAMDRDEVKNTGTPLGNGPSINVNKTIWDEGGTGLLVDTIDAEISDSLTFNVTISNTGNCSLTDIWVTDTLSDSLTYNDNATVNGTNREPDILASPNYTWNLSDFAPLLPGGSINITFSANVTSCGVDVNEVTANATCDGNEEYLASGTGNATVNTPYPVGGEVLPIDKVSILAPWIALAALLMVGLTWLTLRRWRLKSQA